MSINNIYDSKINELLQIRPIPSLEDRKEIIENINNHYFDDTGKTLPSVLINKLTDWFLAEELSNKEGYKMQTVEYPLLSFYQTKRRLSRTVFGDVSLLDFFIVAKKQKIKAGKIKSYETAKEVY